MSQVSCTHLSDDPNRKSCLECLNNAVRQLEKDVAFWKDAWYDQRYATGKAAWAIPSPAYLSPSQQVKFLQLAETIKCNFIMK